MRKDILSFDSHFVREIKKKNNNDCECKLLELDDHVDGPYDEARVIHTLIHLSTRQVLLQCRRSIVLPMYTVWLYRALLNHL